MEEKKEAGGTPSPGKTQRRRQSRFHLDAVGYFKKFGGGAGNFLKFGYNGNFLQNVFPFLPNFKKVGERPGGWDRGRFLAIS